MHSRQKEEGNGELPHETVREGVEATGRRRARCRRIRPCGGRPPDKNSPFLVEVVGWYSYTRVSEIKAQGEARQGEATRRQTKARSFCGACRIYMHVRITCTCINPPIKETSTAPCYSRAALLGRLRTSEHVGVCERALLRFKNTVGGWGLCGSRARPQRAGIGPGGRGHLPSRHHPPPADRRRPSFCWFLLLKRGNATRAKMHANAPIFCGPRPHKITYRPPPHPSFSLRLARLRANRTKKLLRRGQALISQPCLASAHGAA